MNIICSVGLGEMAHTDCLACAAKHDRPPCGYDYAILRAMFGSSQQGERASTIHVTDLTGCARKAFLDKRHPAAERPHEMLVRWMGSSFHSLVEADDPLFKSELKVAWDGIVGSSDLVYENGRLVDMKFTRWMYINKLPYGSHALQVNLYAWMLRRMGRNIDRLQIQYIDASGPTKCRKCRVTYRMIGGVLECPKCHGTTAGAHLGAYLADIPVMSDEEVEDAIKHRKENLEAALAMGIPPEREPGFLCSYCAHYEVCQPELVEV